MDETIPENGEVLYKRLNLKTNSLFVELQVGDKVIHQEYNLVKESENVAYQTPNMSENKEE